LLSAAAAQGSGLSPLRVGLGCVSCGIVGMVGARIYYLITAARDHTDERFWAEAWNSNAGGWSVFGGLLIVPYSFLLAAWVGIPLATYWDHMIVGIVSGAVFIRFGCVCNGCCGGRPTTKWYGRNQHNTCGVRLRRIPVQLLEIGWWLVAGAALFGSWAQSFPPGSRALAVLCWYGLGRLWLEPLREEPQRVNQLVAALLTLGAGGALMLLVS
jgi:prolipoprotein diacylglyceryltransferase